MVEASGLRLLIELAIRWLLKTSAGCRRRFESSSKENNGKARKLTGSMVLLLLGFGCRRRLFI